MEDVAAATAVPRLEPFSLVILIGVLIVFPQGK